MSAVGAGEEVVPASEYRALQSQVRELQRLLGKKTLDNEILREAWDLAQPKKRANTKPAASSPKLTRRPLPPRNSWFADSSLERAGFEPSVPGESGFGFAPEGPNVGIQLFQRRAGRNPFPPPGHSGSRQE